MPPPARPPLVVSLPVAVAAGGLHVAVFPPWGAPALAFVALVPILAVLRLEDRTWSGGLLGWVFGFASGLAAAYWVHDVLMSGYGIGPRSALAFTAAAIAFQTSFFAIFGALAVRLRRGWLPSILAAPLGWCTGELLRTQAIQGIPWLLYGHSLYESPVLIQLAEIGGVAGLSFTLLLVNALLVEAALARWRRRRPLRLVAGAVAAVVGLAGFGALRLAALDAAPAEAGSVRIGLVQTATTQPERWESDFRERNLERHLALTREAVAAGATVVIWSETAIDFLPPEEPELPARIAAALGDDPQRRLLAGAPLESAARVYTNSALVFDGVGRQLESYAKIQLVPFSEREPGWIDALPGLRPRLRRMVVGTPYTAGDDPRPLALDGLRAGVLICFEGIFPDLARAEVAAGADVLVNISNDGFFQVGGAEEQHFAGTVFRAVETRRPLLRVANLGVGALVDATGRVLQRVEPRQRTMTVVEVAPRSGTSLFCAGGWILPWALGALSLLGLIPSRAGSGKSWS